MDIKDARERLGYLRDRIRNHVHTGTVPTHDQVMVWAVDVEAIDKILEVYDRDHPQPPS
jgi:hypothetical protein